MTTSTITVYSRTTCGPCKTLKTWLNHKGVSYNEVDVDSSPAAVKELIDRTGYMVVPVTIVGDQAVVGPNFSRLASML